MKEFDLYRGAYCGICKAMGRETGQLSRLTLSFDAVFLFFLRTALTKEPFDSNKEHCVIHPITKRSILSNSPQLSYTAKAMAVLTSGKIDDDIEDEKGIKFTFSLLLRPYGRNIEKRADLPLLSEKVKEKLKELSLSEKDTSISPSFDRPAAIFGELLSEVFCYGFDEASPNYRIAHEVGLHLGKFIYAADAADDIEKDLKRNSYNPYISLFGGPLSDEQKETVLIGAKNELKRIEDALSLIDFSGISGIEAILYNTLLGMEDKMKNILYKNDSKQEKVSEGSI